MKESLKKTLQAFFLVVLIFETGYIANILRRRWTSELTEIAVVPGKNYSLLIDNERFPIRARAGQEIRLRVVDTTSELPPLPPRVIIDQVSRQNKMAVVTESRFRFSYNSPQELRDLYVAQNLDKLRKSTDWDTIQAVLERVGTTLQFGSPSVYPPENAIALLNQMRKGKQKVFCAQYCYVTVQFLQALGYYARYLTVVGHEVCEVWVPQMQKWICLDPTNGVYYEDERGKKLSALEISRLQDRAHIKCVDKRGPMFATTSSYREIWYWLCNDLATNPVNIYDLNKYRVWAIQNQSDFHDLELGDLYTLYPDELYSPPVRATSRKST